MELKWLILEADEKRKKPVLLNLDHVVMFTPLGKRTGVRLTDGSTIIDAPIEEVAQALKDAS